ncbi:MAG: F0F1 ATP synthase subunit alpha [Candidatus Omnitrophica bacterium]|nr:F0F1 ATP synthase subunit alpha [Candidatus Omnitrophota bacterium]
MSSSGFDVKEVGSILEVRKVIARIKGLPSIAYGQPLEFEGGTTGMVIGFDKQTVSALLFGDAATLKSGDNVIARDESLRVPVGNAFMGRIVNGLAVACDGKGPIPQDDFYPVFAEAPGITERASLTKQIFTGTKIVDMVTPISRGQRQLIIGDRVTGKTTIAADAVLNQKGKNMICVYCSIGRSFNFLLKLTQLFQERGAMSYSVIVGSAADAPPGEQYLAPYTAACIGEYFMRHGRDVLMVFDDLSKHAWVYRQISLLMDRPPGREAYPGDIFFIHSQLVERAAQLKPEFGGGSMTFLPMIETQQGDLTSYVSSNLISMTDGQIYMGSELFQEGFKPAIDLGLSVSRIGNKIQCPAMRALCATLRIEYIQYKELVNMTKLRSSVSKEAQAKLRHGQVIAEVFKQDKNEPIDMIEQILLAYALRKGILDDLPPDHVRRFKRTFYSYATSSHPDAVDRLKSELSLTEAVKEGLDHTLEEYFKSPAFLELEETVSLRA